MKGINFRIQISVNDNTNFKNCMEKSGLNSSRYQKKVPTPRTL